MNLLLVDDDHDTSELMAMLFEREGLSVTTAISVATARAAMQQTPFQALLTDLYLPDGSGMTLLETGRPPTLKWAAVLTGLRDPQQQARSTQLGFDAYFTKPVDIDVLSKTLRGALDMQPSSA